MLDEERMAARLERSWPKRPPSFPGNALVSMTAVILDLVRPLLGVGVIVVSLVRLGDEEDDEEEPSADDRHDEQCREGRELEVVRGQEGDTDDRQDGDQEHLRPEPPTQHGPRLARVLTVVSLRLRRRVFAHNRQLPGAIRTVRGGRSRKGATLARSDAGGQFECTVTRFGHWALSLKSIYRIGAGSANLGVLLDQLYLLYHKYIKNTTPRKRWGCIYERRTASLSFLRGCRQPCKTSSPAYHRIYQREYPSRRESYLPA
jgi:hypothetical protein